MCVKHELTIEVNYYVENGKKIKEKCIVQGKGSLFTKWNSLFCCFEHSAEHCSVGGLGWRAGCPVCLGMRILGAFQIITVPVGDLQLWELLLCKKPQSLAHLTLEIMPNQPH